MAYYSKPAPAVPLDAVKARKYQILIIAVGLAIVVGGLAWLNSTSGPQHFQSVVSQTD